MFDLLLFSEDAGVALAQGTARSPKAGQPGGWAGRGDHVVAGPCLCPLSPHSLVTLRCHHVWVRKPLAQAMDLDVWLLQPSGVLPQPPSLSPCQARRNWQETRGQPPSSQGWEDGRWSGAGPLPASGGQPHGGARVRLGGRWGTPGLWREREPLYPGWRPAGWRGSGSEPTQ